MKLRTMYFEYVFQVGHQLVAQVDEVNWPGGVEFDQ